MGAHAPKGLDTQGRKLWEAIAKSYDLRPDELSILEDACRERDLVALMEAALSADLRRALDHSEGLRTKGSQGQDVINPLVSELRQHRALLATLLGKLRLPDEGDGAVDMSSAARAAANARWGKRGA